jgi:hypothetical protein
VLSAADPADRAVLQQQAEVERQVEQELPASPPAGHHPWSAAYRHQQVRSDLDQRWLRQLEHRPAAQQHQVAERQRQLDRIERQAEERQHQHDYHQCAATNAEMPLEQPDWPSVPADSCSLSSRPDHQSRNYEQELPEPQELKVLRLLQELKVLR